MLKVGDRVRSTGTHADITEGREYVVLERDDDDNSVRVKDDVGDRWWLFEGDYELVPVAEATGTDAPKFKVGDRVKFRDDYNSSARGTEATVVKVDSWGIMVDGVHGKSTEQPSSLRLVAEATSGKFKVGDRVRVHNHPYYLEEDEHTGTIISRSDDRGDWDVDLDNYDGADLSFRENELTPITTTLTIQPGRYYLTRDGRKVGPMEIHGTDLFKVPDDIHGRLWRADGGRYSRNNDHDDLIAEWVDEPSDVFDELERWMADNPQPANDNSTAGFTIPLCALEAEPDLTAIGKAYADGYAAGLAVCRAA